MRSITIGAAVLVAFSFTLGATPLLVNSSTAYWTKVGLGSGNPMDYLSDQQTGQGESDIVGDLGPNAGFYYYFDDNGAASQADGTMYFRVRLGKDQNPAGFKNVLWIGLDADANMMVSNAAIDIWIGVDNAGGVDRIKIFDNGSDLNISPNTTSISAPANQKIYNQTASNYHWGPVNSTIDPAATNYDLNGDGTDYFLSFTLPFADIVAEVQRLSGIVMNDDTPLLFVVATSTQNNSLNQDIGGVPKTYDGELGWAALGAVTVPLSAGGGILPPPEPQPVPEPSTFLLVGGALFAISRRRAGN